MSQSVTLKDIAEEAKLSVAAVSKALAGDPHISDATRKRVRHISHRLNYKPRGRRRALSQERRVKLVLGDVNQMARYSSLWLPALSQAAGRRGLRLELSGIRELAGDRWLAELEREVEGMVGLLLFGCVKPASVEAIRRLELPCVMVGDLEQTDHGTPPPIHCVNTDKVAMARFATQRLIEAGHERIGFFCAPYPSGGWNDQWLTGYRLALMYAGLPDDAAIRPVLATPNRDDIGVDAAHHMTALDNPPTAYVVPTVHGAARFRQTMSGLGIELGPDRLVIGGRLEEATDYGLETYPLLAEPAGEMAVLASDILARLIDVESLPIAQTIIPFHVYNFPSQN